MAKYQEDEVYKLDPNLTDGHEVIMTLMVVGEPTPEAIYLQPIIPGTKYGPGELPTQFGILHVCHGMTATTDILEGATYLGKLSEDERIGVRDLFNYFQSGIELPDEVMLQYTPNQEVNTMTQEYLYAMLAIRDRSEQRVRERIQQE